MQREFYDVEVTNRDGDLFYLKDVPATDGDEAEIRAIDAIEDGAMARVVGVHD